MVVGLGGGIYGLLHLLGALWIIYDVWAKNGVSKDIKKIVWTILAVIFGFFSAIAYYLIEKR